MSRTIARLLLSMLLMPLMIVVYIGIMIVLSEIFSMYNHWPLFAAWGGTWLIAGAYWLAIWHSSVNWTTTRVRHTVWTVFAAGGCGLAVYFLTFLGAPLDSEPAAFFGSVIAILGWLIATVFLWRETPVERAERLAKLGAGNVACPACGYNLTGLKTTTCPECGASFSIQELVAAARGIGELEG
jgi:hypothetical protein